MVAAAFVRVDLTENQIGLRTENGALVEVLAPATRRLYWKGLIHVQIEVIDIGASAEVPATLVAFLVQTQLRHHCGPYLERQQAIDRTVEAYIRSIDKNDRELKDYADAARRGCVQ